MLPPQSWSRHLIEKTVEQTFLQAVISDIHLSKRGFYSFFSACLIGVRGCGQEGVGYQAELGSVPEPHSLRDSKTPLEMWDKNVFPGISLRGSAM